MVIASVGSDLYVHAVTNYTGVLIYYHNWESLSKIVSLMKFLYPQAPSNTKAIIIMFRISCNLLPQNLHHYQYLVSKYRLFLLLINKGGGGEGYKEITVSPQ